MAIEKKKDTVKDAASGAADPGQAEVGEAEAGQPITVHSYAGFKSDERPRSFELDGKKLTVLMVIKTWREESAQGHHRKTVFRVHAHDGRQYDIALDEGTAAWSLEPRRARD